ncbi:MAG: carbamoyl phosphate synthase small subunit [Fastidiosipilaceae bacterium]|jgi:carbamoyl-phosphate synthase small subunit|nr:carbamoyl phosphate synthase small subunit [Clostridiaceae bacterium]
MDGFLILEDGKVFQGKAFGAIKSCIFEVVFNTAMAGYTESISDPSLAGLGVVMAFPSLGNHGVRLIETESDQPTIAALFVRTYYDGALDEKADLSIDDWLKQNNIPGLWDIDTRELTRYLRENGTMRGMLCYDKCPHFSDVRKALYEWEMPSLIPLTSTQNKQFFPACQADFNNKDNLVDASRPHIGLIDYGSKRSIINLLNDCGADVTVYPYNVSAEEIFNDQVQGILLSNGPGDPKFCDEVVFNTIRALTKSDLPIMAIGLGHLLVALVLGLDTEKMYFGHRGTNHPVREIATDQFFVTVQNHGYVVTTVSLETADVPVELTYCHIDDESVEGLSYFDGRIETYQFHPEGSPGPKDTMHLFERFIERIVE